MANSTPTKREREAAIFTAFLATQPDFARTPIAEWSQPEQDPPDILCLTREGRRLGVELKTWANEAQVAEAKSLEYRQNDIGSALDPQPPNASEHLAFVWAVPAVGRLPRNDRPAFRTQFLDAMVHIEERWPNDWTWDDPGGFRFTALAAWPLLAQYLSHIHLFSLRHHERRGSGDAPADWISFRSRAKAYSGHEMLEPLIDLVHNSWGQYQGTKEALGLDELHLVIHYDYVALHYCTPVETLFFNFEEAARIAVNQVRMRTLLEEPDPSPFDGVFLFVALTGQEEVFRISRVP